MSRTFHPKKSTRRTGKVRREGSNRAMLRQTLHNGAWDELPTTLPTRAVRTSDRLA